MSDVKWAADERRLQSAYGMSHVKSVAVGE
jgi:hypothetical protein